MFVKVIISGVLSSVYQEEAASLIAKGLAHYPGEQKAVEPTYENKMVQAYVHNKRGRKAK